MASSLKTMQKCPELQANLPQPPETCVEPLAFFVGVRVIRDHEVHERHARGKGYQLWTKYTHLWPNEVSNRVCYTDRGTMRINVFGQLLRVLGQVIYMEVGVSHVYQTMQ